MTADTRSIDELFQCVVAGERNAFAGLHRAMEPRIRATVLRTLLDPWQSDEVTQEVFLEIWQKAAAFDPRRGSAVTWMLTIANRRAIDRVRAAQASRDRDLRDAARNQDRPHDQVWETVESRFSREILLRGLQRISPLQREALTSTYLHGRTIAQAAEHLGASETALKTRVRDGIAHLRNEISSMLQAA